MSSRSIFGKLVQFAETAMDTLLFIALPYVALSPGDRGWHLSLRSQHRYNYSTPFLGDPRESKTILGFGALPLRNHGDSLGALVRSAVSRSCRLASRRTRCGGLALELTGMALGLYALFGLVVLIAFVVWSRNRWCRRRHLTWTALLLFVLLVELGTGVGVAIFNRWGGLWYLHTAVPWFWSLAALHPDISTVASLPALPNSTL